MSDRIGGGPLERLVILGAHSWLFLLKPPLVGNRLLLDVFDVQRPPNSIICIENVGRRLLPQHLADEPGQVDGVVDAEVQPKTAERIVDVCSIACKERASFAKGG